MAQPLPCVRAFDQPGDVGHDEAAIVAQRHDAEVGRERGERIVGDLGTRRRDARDQRGLAGVGEADEADVGEQLQLQPEEPLFARLARLGAPRRAVGGRHEVRVAAPAAAAFATSTLAFLGEIGEQVQSSPSDAFSKTSVPSGTSISRSSAVWPVLFEPWPCLPRGASNSG